MSEYVCISCVIMGVHPIETLLINPNGLLQVIHSYVVFSTDFIMIYFQNHVVPKNMLHAWSHDLNGNSAFIIIFKFYLDVYKKLANTLNTSMLDTYKEKENSPSPKD